jgi:hypothetical protein
MQFSPPSYHYVPHLSECSQHPFSNTLSLGSSLNVRDKVSQPYRTIGKIIVLYLLILNFWTADEKTEGSGLSGSKHNQTSIFS